MNREMGEVDSSKEEVNRQWKIGRDSCLAVEICERVRAAHGAQRSLWGQRGQVTLKQLFSVICVSVGEGCERLARRYRSHTACEVGEDP